MNPMNPKMYSIEFSPSELEQLLKVLYQQTVLQDEAAIRLIAKINAEVHAQSMLNSNGQNPSSNYDLDIKMMTAAETYHRYRTDHLGDVPRKIDDLGESASESSPVLRKIAESLETITAHLNQEYREPLGFVPCYPQLVVYRDAQIGRYWYQVNAQRQMISIAARALTCRVQSISLIRDKSGESQINLLVQADQVYRLNIPSKSVFGKTLILGLASLSPAQLRSPITIEPVRSSSRQVVTCKLYQQGGVLRHSTCPAVHWPTLIQELQQKLEQIQTGY
jgi:hypothetical protein